MKAIKKYEDAMSDISPEDLIADLEGKVYENEKAEEAILNEGVNDEADEFDDDYDDDDESGIETDELQVVSEKEYKKEIKKNRANDRIRDLVEERNQMKAELAELRAKLSTPQTENKPKFSETVPDDIDEQQLLQQLYSKDPKELLAGLKNISGSTSKKVAKEILAELLPTLNTLALKDKANSDGLTKSDLDSVYEKHPELKNLPDGGYEIAKQLIGKKKTRSKSISNSARSTSSLLSKSSGNKISKRQMQEALLAELIGK